MVLKLKNHLAQSPRRNKNRLGAIWHGVTSEVSCVGLPIKLMLGLFEPFTYMWNKRLVYGTVIQLAEMADSKSVKCGFEFHQCYQPILLLVEMLPKVHPWSWEILDKWPKYCAGRLTVGRQTHYLETTFNSFVRNHSLRRNSRRGWILRFNYHRRQ